MSWFDSWSLLLWPAPGSLLLPVTLTIPSILCKAQKQRDASHTDTRRLRIVFQICPTNIKMDPSEMDPDQLYARILVRHENHHRWHFLFQNSAALSFNIIATWQKKLAILFRDRSRKCPLSLLFLTCFMEESINKGCLGMTYKSLSGSACASSLLPMSGHPAVTLLPNLSQNKLNWSLLMNVDVRSPNTIVMSGIIHPCAHAAKIPTMIITRSLVSPNRNYRK